MSLNVEGALVVPPRRNLYLSGRGVRCAMQIPSGDFMCDPYDLSPLERIVRGLLMTD